MDKVKKNKAFIVEYFNAISGVPKTNVLIDKYITDEKLKSHIYFFEGAFPNYEMFIDEMTAEGNRVVVRARVKGKHEGELNGIPATHKEIEMPFAISYEIENNKIISHWLLADLMMAMEQLGVMKQPV